MSAYALFLLITIVVNGPLSPVLPAAYEPILIYFGPLFGTVTTAALGTIGILFVEYVNYRLHQKLLRTRTVQRIVGGALVQRVVALFSKRPALTVWLCAWSPLPYWPVRLLSPLAGLSLRKYLVATALGRFPQYLAVLWLGAQLNLSTPALVAIVAGSTALAVGVGLIRRLWRPAVVGAGLLAATLIAVENRAAIAQEIPPFPAGTSVGLTADQFRVEDEAYRSVTFHVSELKPRGVGPEFAFSFFPSELDEGSILANLDLGVAKELDLKTAAILLRVGASGLFALGQSSGAALPGFHFGASLLVRVKDRVGLRFDVIQRQYLPYPIGTLTFGVGVAMLPR